MSVAVEIAVQDLEGLRIAAHAGADRVELCSDLARGGLTPDPELIGACVAEAARLRESRDAKPAFDVHVLIRSRAGDGDLRETDGEFVYDEAEIARMAEQAAGAVGAGAAGVVIGALTEQRTLDVPALEALRDAALQAGSDALRGVHLTCHRAVDALVDDDAREAAVTTLLALGFHRVLSSGGARSALEGAACLSRIVDAADGLIDICAGAGIRPVDVPQLVGTTGVGDIHLSARRRSADAGSGPGTGSQTSTDAPTSDAPPAGTSPLPDGPAADPFRTDPAVVQAVVDAAGEV
ncbi:copper resistance protein [Brachybacterium endophyticum]|uniref:PF03932 family protein CutC n=1 Tax=Brachybacterium endophyticum TaxID=2182385 RepID=A0A2U2RPI3_9MICO|nr:copper homeostasis protein CutC [Brachybacterium endophyticum]PWH07715.1 copper resistance protein [Brachybacterium endophyticum]